MNVAVMAGRLTNDPEVRYSQAGKAVANFRIAVDRRFKREGQPDADFFNVVCFGKTAEFIEKYFRKGMKINLSGSLQNDSYPGKDGTERYITQIVADSVEFGESKGQADPAPAKPKVPDFVAVPDDLEQELPFM